MVINVYLKKPNQIISIVFFICCAIGVSWGVFRSTPPPEIFYHSDKILHSMAFAVLAYSGRMAMPMLSPFIYWPMISVVAVAMEYAQGLIQISRTTSIEDALANLMGLGLVFVAEKIVGKKIKTSEVR